MLVEFKGKVMTGVDWDDPDLPEVQYVRIPVIKPSHVVTSHADLTTRERLWLRCNDADSLKSRTCARSRRRGRTAIVSWSGIPAWSCWAMDSWRVSASSWM